MSARMTRVSQDRVQLSDHIFPITGEPAEVPGPGVLPRRQLFSEVDTMDKIDKFSDKSLAVVSCVDVNDPRLHQGNAPSLVE